MCACALACVNLFAGTNALCHPKRVMLTTVMAEQNITVCCTGGMGLLWSWVWLSRFYDSPSQHPSLSRSEAAYFALAARTEGSTPSSQCEVTHGGQTDYVDGFIQPSLW